MNKLFATLFAACLFSAAVAQDEPVVTTNPRFARGATMAFGRATFKATNGNTITERGFCWSSETQTPTIDGDHSKDYVSNAGLIYKMTGLQPATVYYARPYAIAKNGSVGYGDVIKIVTLPMGTVSYGYDNGGNSEENERINNAVASCVDYWNNLTNIEGLYLNVHYGAQTPTADCSYGGWMRVGPNASYQRTGTIMHEALHAIGVGTHSVWNGSSSPLRAGSGTGQWLGTRANDFLRFWDNNETAVLTGDATHLWPYGINGAHEDNGTEALYLATSLIAQAVGEDGLPCTNQRPFGSPYYSFNHEDGVKYYIKNESETYGLLTSFLTQGADGKLEWRQMTAAEASADDAAAWFFSFTPDNQYYQLCNASTGRVFDYGNVQLMPSRIDVKTADGTVIPGIHSYWMVVPEYNGSLSAGNNGSVSVANFDLSDNATRQRWVIVNAQQASDMENSGLLAARESFLKTKSKVESLLLTECIELQEGAVSQFSSAVSSLASQCESASDIAEINSLTESLLAAAKVYLISVCVASLDNPFPLTFMLRNPDFATDKSGWTGTITSSGSWAYQTVEFYQSSVNVTQTLNEMPHGSYSLSMQGFQRPGSYTDVYNAFIGGTDNSAARLYLNSASTGSVLVKNIMSERSASRLHTDDKQMADGTFIPNTMASAAAHFQNGRYDNTTTYCLPSDGNLKVGFIATNNTGSSYWTIFTNFRLAYFGPMSIEEIEQLISTGIESVADGSCSAESHSLIYNIAGQPQNVDAASLPAGLYIINGQKTLVK